MLFTNGHVLLLLLPIHLKRLQDLNDSVLIYINLAGGRDVDCAVTVLAMVLFSVPG
jgi:hypothetical protein